jgi:Protein of unknown function (DUF3617)
MKARRSSLARSVALAAAGLSTLLMAQALQLRPGNYEIVVLTQVQLPPNIAAALPPGALARMQQPQTHQQCITDSDLERVGRQMAGQKDPDMRCQMTAHSVTGNHVTFTEQCPNGPTVQFDGTVDSDAFQGTLHSTTQQGATVDANIKAHRLGNCAG